MASLALIPLAPITVTTTPGALPASPCSGVLVQNSNASANNILVGGPGGQPIELEPGDAIYIEVTNTSAVWLAAASGTATAKPLARS